MEQYLFRLWIMADRQLDWPCHWLGVFCF